MAIFGIAWPAAAALPLLPGPYEASVLEGLFSSPLKCVSYLIESLSHSNMILHGLFAPVMVLFPSQMEDSEYWSPAILVERQFNH